MSCSTCSHTMQHLGFTPGEESIYWCQRCGTIKNGQEGKPFPPKIVERAKAVCDAIRYDDVYAKTGITGPIDTLKESCSSK